MMQNGADFEENLTPKEQALLAALLTEPTLTAAAEKAGIHRNTARRYMQREEFKAAHRDAQDAMFGASFSSAQSLSELADKRIRELIEDSSTPVSVRARLLIHVRTHALRAMEVRRGVMEMEEFETELAELRQMLESETGVGVWDGS
jgi:hypothetical protein